MTPETARLICLLASLAGAALALYLWNSLRHEWHAGRMAHQDYHANRLLTLLMLGTVALLFILSVQGSIRP